MIDTLFTGQFIFMENVNDNILFGFIYKSMKLMISYI